MPRPTPPRSDVPLELSDEQRARLLRVKLAGLVRDLTGRDSDPVPIGGNVAVVVADTAYVLTETAAPAALAGALAWTLRQGAARLVLLVDDLAGTLARMAGSFRLPVDVRTVQGATSVSTGPDPLPAQLEGAATDALLGQLAAEGLEVVTEDGIVRGEVLGLEVARLVVWPTELGGDGELHLEAGVGRFDRDAVAAMHQGEDPSDTLARSVALVREQRRPGGSGHPLALMARERWLRSEILADPTLVGATELQPVQTTVRRDSVRESSPAAAFGVAADGRPLVVVCSTGVDLGLVPVAADTRALSDPSARLVLALPARDRLPSTVELAALLVEPAEVLAVPEPWVAA
jgi:hypothetical protein